MGEAARRRPTRWDYAIAGLAGLLLLSIPAGIVSALVRLATDAGAESLVAAAFGLVWMAFCWWMGVGSWRLTYWARARHIGRQVAEHG
jgi:hypothetical protein